MRWWAYVSVCAVACGGIAHEVTIANQPAGPQAPSCTDVGPILRGPLGSDNKQAGPAREAAIEKACRDDAWSSEIVTCVTSTRRPAKCVDKLTKPQRAAYQAKLDVWSSKYGGDSYGDDHDE